MKGGYIEDDIFMGNDLPSIYDFNYWEYVDIFIYFSHNFITIPVFNLIIYSQFSG